jgi:hypothetical protein
MYLTEKAQLFTMRKESYQKLDRRETVSCHEGRNFEMVRVPSHQGDMWNGYADTSQGRYEKTCCRNTL